MADVGILFVVITNWAGSCDILRAVDTVEIVSYQPETEENRNIGF